MFPRSVKNNQNQLFIFSGSAFLEFGEFSSAVNYLEKLYPLDSRYVSAYVNLGVTYRRKGGVNKAIEALKLALSIDPTNSFALYNIALHTIKKGLLDKSLGYYKEY